jgi:hypothetical protein
MVATEEKIKQWKQNFGRVFYVSLSGIDIYFKTLTRTDYLEIVEQQQLNPDLDPELETVSKCIINEEVTADDLMKIGGIVTVLYEQIMTKSGFVNVEAQEL